MSKATVVVPTEASVSGVSAGPSKASVAAESESSTDSDEEEAEEVILSVVPAGGVSAGLDAAGEHDLSAAGSGVGAVLAGAGGPSLFAGTSFYIFSWKGIHKTCTA